jgi:hypothetical protein
MNPWLLLVVLGLATYRVTRVVVLDGFPPVRAPREWIMKHGPEWLADLVSCHYCASAYVSGGLVTLADLFGSVPMPGLTWLAAWAIGALIADWDARP